MLNNTNSVIYYQVTFEARDIIREFREIASCRYPQHCGSYGLMKQGVFWDTLNLVTIFFLGGMAYVHELLDDDTALKRFHQVEQVYAYLSSEPYPGLTKESIKRAFVGSIKNMEERSHSDNLPIAWYIHSDIVRNLDIVLKKGIQLRILTAVTLST